MDFSATQESEKVERIRQTHLTGPGDQEQSNNSMLGMLIENRKSSFLFLKTEIRFSVLKTGFQIYF